MVDDDPGDFFGSGVRRGEWDDRPVSIMSSLNVSSALVLDRRLACGVSERV